ncbi:MAG: hypothetical protein J1F16_00580 [Muribaculaceae bacterium]|nr:hypothetical protein [Muribaculaceae bacterium]
MKKNYILSGLTFILLFLGCSKIKTPEAKIEREKWIAGFSDSIDYYKQQTQRIEENLQEINSKISNQLENFEMIKKAREVSGYYLLKGWSSKVPFTTTSIYARINENEKIELIATLQGSTFNQIAVGDGVSEVYSEKVPHDQAFNFRHERYNTVYFSGGKADTIAQFIAEHKTEKITLKFLEGKVKQNFIIPGNEKDMISSTWNLFNSQMEARTLQKELWICSRKIDTFRRMMDANKEMEPENLKQK